MFEALVRRLGGNSQSIGRLLIACMMIGFASVIAAGVAAAWSTVRNQDHISWVNHTYSVELAVARADLLIEQAETTRRGYIIARQSIYLDTYKAMLAQVPGAIERIAALISRQSAPTGKYRAVSGTGRRPPAAPGSD